MATFAFLICGAFWLGLMAGQWLTDRRWASNADTYIRTEYKGRIYKVVYADGKSQTILWPVDGRYDGFVSASLPKEGGE